MANLVALDVALSAQFVDAVKECWADGDAVFPIDQRWPPAMRDRILADMRPTHLIRSDGSRIHLTDGRSTEDGDALLIATSGSTGSPKGVVHTFDSLHASANACHQRIGFNAHWLACLPPAHIGGFSVIARSLMLGLPLTIADGTTAEAITDATRVGATHVSIVSTMLDRIDPSAFDSILIGGAKPPEIRPANAITTYGSTETGSGVAYDGRALDGVELRIGPSEEILVRGPMLMRAYRDGTTPFDCEGWLDTGDAGMFTAEGNLRVHGRRTEMIITGGENVWPDAVERVLLSDSRVRQCAVFGRSDKTWGHAVCALVVSISEITESELRDIVASQLPRYCVPKEIRFVNSLPQTPGGKVDRRALSI